MDFPDLTGMRVGPRVNVSARGSAPEFGGRYKLLRLIGEGGMGAVYEAEDAQLGVRVAVKVVFFMGVGKDVIAKRFEAEARNHAKLREIPAIVTIHDSGIEEEGGFGYLVMQYLDGESLEDWLSEMVDDPDKPGRKKSVRRKLTPKDAKLLKGWIADVGDALCCAHALGLVHRDIKPSNIFLHKTASGRIEVKLIDFGIARQNDADGQAVERHTKTGIMNGTPHYMAPEQMWASSIITGRADQYALAVVLYEAFTRRLPRLENEVDPTHQRVIGAMMEALREDRAPNMSLLPDFVEQELRDALLKALSEKPEDRYKSIWELTAVLCATVSRQPPPIPRGDPLFDPNEGTQVLGLTPMVATTQGASAGPDTMQEAAVSSSTHRAPRKPRSVWAIASAMLALIAVAGITIIAALELGMPSPPRHVANVDAATARPPGVHAVVDAGVRPLPTRINVNVADANSAQDDAAIVRAEPDTGVTMPEPNPPTPPTQPTPPQPTVAVVLQPAPLPARPERPRHSSHGSHGSRRELTEVESGLVTQCRSSTNTSGVTKIHVPGGADYDCPSQWRALRGALLATHQ